jgi:pantoate--beta-alanine ligase
MITTGSMDEVGAETARAGANGAVVGFVPTMGALHEAPLSLVRRSRRDGCFTVVSIYVNPAQFGPREDFDRYPRPLDRDLALCEKESVDLVFTPSTGDMYPEAHATWVHVEKLTGGLCGAMRPGHFRGVATVVAKLLGIVRPGRAYFGRKDYQQLKVIERMAADLHLPVTIVGCPTLRDDDGIAMSSRNAYLSPEERDRARVIPEVLAELSSRWDGGMRDPGGLMAGLHERLSEKTDRVESFSLVHPETLQSLPKDEPLKLNPLIALAVRVGRTRLIDNIQPGVDAPPAVKTG